MCEFDEFINQCFFCFRPLTSEKGSTDNCSWCCKKHNFLYVHHEFSSQKILIIFIKGKSTYSVFFSFYGDSFEISKCSTMQLQESTYMLRIQQHGLKPAVVKIPLDLDILKDKVDFYLTFS